MTDMYLVKFKADYADEFDVVGFRLMTEESMGAYFDFKCKLFEENELVEWYFGTNEFIGWEFFIDFSSCFSFRRLTEDEADKVRELFGTEYGNFPDF